MVERLEITVELSDPRNTSTKGVVAQIRKEAEKGGQKAERIEVNSYEFSVKVKRKTYSGQPNTDPTLATMDAMRQAEEAGALSGKYKLTGKVTGSYTLTKAQAPAVARGGGCDLHETYKTEESGKLF